MKYIMIVVFALGVSACGNTMSGFKTDIDSKRQAMSDFINPSSDSSEPVEEEKKSD
jgi:predicted small secreted protein